MMPCRLAVVALQDAAGDGRAAAVTVGAGLGQGAGALLDEAAGARDRGRQSSILRRRPSAPRRPGRTTPPAPDSLPTVWPLSLRSKVPPFTAARPSRRASRRRPVAGCRPPRSCRRYRCWRPSGSGCRAVLVTLPVPDMVSA